MDHLGLPNWCGRSVSRDARIGSLRRTSASWKTWESTSQARRGLPSPGTDRRWLYAWQKKLEAERFVDELRRRTGVAEWMVYQFEDASEDRDPVAPLVIARIPDQDGETYDLTPASRERVSATFPGSRLPPASTCRSASSRTSCARGGTRGGWKSLRPSPRPTSRLRSPAWSRRRPSRSPCSSSLFPPGRTLAPSRCGPAGWSRT